MTKKFVNLCDLNAVVEVSLTERESNCELVRVRYQVNPNAIEAVASLLNKKVHWATPSLGQAKPLDRFYSELFKVVGDHE